MITPRTCLWPLTFAILITFGLSIGLTFVSHRHCYAGVCGEWLFPLQARLHVVVWYSWLSVSVRQFSVPSEKLTVQVAALTLRTFSSRWREVLRKHIFPYQLPLLKKHVSVSGLLLVTWILCLYGALIGVWWLRLQQYFEIRGQHGGVMSGNMRLAAIAQTGHLADVTMGLVLLPISRHSALSAFFKLSISTTLTFHMMIAYLLFVLVIIHGMIYLSWVPVFNGLSQHLRHVFPVLNPTYLYAEVWPGDTSGLGVWRASLIFTGIFTAFIMLILAITTVPRLRSQHFNVFYFTHLSSIFAIVVICLHASTMFYCLAPGLLMWVLDWAMRLYELGTKLDGKV